MSRHIHFRQHWDKLSVMKRVSSTNFNRIWMLQSSLGESLIGRIPRSTFSSSVITRKPNHVSHSLKYKVPRTIPSARTHPVHVAIQQASILPTNSRLFSSKSKASMSVKDSRANSKLSKLQEVKQNAESAKKRFEEEHPGLNMKKSSSLIEVENDVLYKEWKQEEEKLSSAYGQAIKYLARTNEKDSAFYAHLLLKEAISRAGYTSNTTLYNEDDESKNDIKMILETLIKKKQRIRPIEESLINSIVPPPSPKYFYDILHAWANSKVRKKGFKTEALLVQMMELSLSHQSSFDSMPDSKAFSLAVKAHSGSSHKSKLERIINLHDAHSTCARHGVPNISEDDPNFLMSSLKSLENYQRKREYKLADAWFSRLHSSLLCKKKKSTSSLSTPLDVTAAYNSVIRGLVRAKLRDSTKKASKVLENMHEIQALTPNASGCIIRIKSNTYNLIMSSYRSARTKQSAEQAFMLLNKMINNSKDSTDDSVDIPSPNEQTYDLCMQGLSSHPDPIWVFEKSQIILREYENLLSENADSFEPSAVVYNSLLKLYAKSFAHSPDLLPRVIDIVKKMRKMNTIHPKLQKDSTTLSNIILACSLVPKDKVSSEEALNLAIKTYDDFHDETLGMKIDEGCIYHMICCILNHVEDGDINEYGKTKQEWIEELFAESCRRGLVSYHVLKAFNSAVPSERFKSIVGSGRLASNWVANVTSKKVLYTDGSLGGAGKQVRRIGKNSWRMRNKRTM